VQRVFITGTNRGIGLELARQYAAHGDRVFAACRRASDALNQLATRDHVTIIPLEVTEGDSLAHSVETVRMHTDALDIVFNNAAINPEADGVQDFGTFDANVLLQIMNVNVVAPMMVAQAYFDLLRGGTNPRLVNISSDMGSLTLHDYGGDYGYSSSKAALNMVTRMLAADLRRHNIITVSLDPGWVQTDMGGRSASLTPQESARGILKVVDSLAQRDSGSYLRWDGGTHPW
jgi:NAD(P)-dependent dehydrogenase (short-subunit alcohol dehydrogenase family)